MHIKITIAVLGFLFLISCGKKNICPAFSTYYIHDSTKRYKKFSYFEENKGKEDEEIVNVHSKDLKDYNPEDINRESNRNSKYKPKWEKSQEEFHDNGLKADKTKEKEHHNPMNPGEKKLFIMKKKFLPVQYRGEYKDSLAVPLKDKANQSGQKKQEQNLPQQNPQ